jgi:hypothetical protein
MTFKKTKIKSSIENSLTLFLNPHRETRSEHEPFPHVIDGVPAWIHARIGICFLASHMHDAINLRKLGPRVAMAPRPQPFLLKKCLIFSLNDKNMLVCPSSLIPTSRLIKGPLRRVRRTGRNPWALRDVRKKIRRGREGRLQAQLASMD